MSDDIWTSLRSRRPAAARPGVPVIEQVTCPVCTVFVGLGKAWPVPVLGDSLAVLADQSSEPAQGDPLLQIDPDRTGSDPFRCGEVGLRRQPGVEPGLIEEQLTASTAFAAADRKRRMAAGSRCGSASSAARSRRSGLGSAPRCAGWSGRAFARTLTCTAPGPISSARGVAAWSALH
jgi:hypothetical protein